MIRYSNSTLIHVRKKQKDFFLTAVIFNHAFHVQILLLEMLEFNGGNLEID